MSLIRITIFVFCIQTNIFSGEDYSYLSTGNLFESINTAHYVDPKFKNTYLHLLAESLLNPNIPTENYKSEIELYLNAGYNPNAQNSFGQTPLHVASSWKRLRFIIDLLEVYEKENNNYPKLDLSIKDNWGKTILDSLKYNLSLEKDKSNLNYQVYKILIFYITNKIRNPKLNLPPKLLI